MTDIATELIEKTAQAIRDCVIASAFSDHELYCMGEKHFEYVALQIASAALVEVLKNKGLVLK